MSFGVHKIIFFAVMSMMGVSQHSDAREYQQDPEPSEESCSLYLQLEDKRQCLFASQSQTDYLVSYGYYFCRKLSVLEDRSEPLKEFILNTRKCLQEKLISFEKQVDCQDLEQKAFASHPVCYEEGGFCQLSNTERLLVIKEISDRSLAGKLNQSVKQLQEIARRCAF